MIIEARQDSLEALIARWRGLVRRRRTAYGADVDELEQRLRAEVAALTASGLSADETFLIAIKRMGSRDALSREIAHEHSTRLWTELVAAPAARTDRRLRLEAIVVLGLAFAAGVAVKAPALFGLPLAGDGASFYACNASFFALPLVTAHFAWKRRLELVTWGWLALAVVAGATFANVYPFRLGGDTAMLTSVHLPIALWLVVGTAYVGE
jgi:hypothetical protein